jgi:hypothetical protein
MAITKLTENLSQITFEGSNIVFYNLVGSRYDDILSGIMGYDYSAVGGNPFDQYYSKPKTVIIAEGAGLLTTNNNGFNVPGAGEAGFRDYRQIPAQNKLSLKLRLRSSTSIRTVEQSQRSHLLER